MRRLHDQPAKSPIVKSRPPTLSRDERTISVQIPITLRQQGGRKQVVTSADAALWIPPAAPVDSALVKAFVRARDTVKLFSLPVAAAALIECMEHGQPMCAPRAESMPERSLCSWRSYSTGRDWWRFSVSLNCLLYQPAVASRSGVIIGHGFLDAKSG